MAEVLLEAVTDPKLDGSIEVSQHDAVSDKLWQAPIK
jgi:hypothetical protein